MTSPKHLNNLILIPNSFKSLEALDTKKEMMDFTKILSASITLHSKNLKLETNLRQAEKMMDLLKKIGERN